MTLLDGTLVQKVLKLALARGGDFAEIFVEEKATFSASLEDSLVEELASGTSRGAGIRVRFGDTTGFAHTADLSEAGLNRAIEAASALARGGKGRAAEIAVTPRLFVPLPHEKAVPGSVGKDRKIDLLRRLDAAGRGQGATIRQVNAGYSDSLRRFLVANSDGVFVEEEQVRTRLSISCIALGDTGMQTGYETAAMTMGFELFDEIDVDELAARAANRAIQKLSARPTPSGPMPVVLAGQGGGVLFHEACGHGLEADHILKDSSVYAGRVGERVASPLVTLVDDGTVANQWGTYSHDDEGNPAARNVLIENGVLSDYMWDSTQGSRERRGSSGNGRRQSYAHLPMVRMTNTYLMPGEQSPEEIIADTERGIYVAKLGGGQVNTATGDFVFGMTEAYLIENGQITAPLRDANLIGNGPEVLANIDAVADDFAIIPGTCGKDGQSVPVGCGQPTVRITQVTVGGTAGA
ncbi:MAG: TldD/PmbA family protein [Actinomycetota bacterium]|nr:TldD/PmbA family protein [Actinomycetota bacterium]